MTKRLRVHIQGVVQGVGFRPFIYRLARELQLSGWVQNASRGVLIEVEGTMAALGVFLARIPQEKPAQACLLSVEQVYLDPRGYQQFEIRKSNTAGPKTALILPDIATCPQCLAEINDPANRRYRYPFTNCTHCGPRFSIIEALPYDRPHTTMKNFQMCPACRAEYEDPGDRRFHAQPNACPECGPRLSLWDGAGNTLAEYDNALQATAAAIQAGRIVAVKGLGGFHLMVDAANSEAVARLRNRKHREEKPLALMFPELAQIDMVCRMTQAEKTLLTSPQAPIVLLRKSDNGTPAFQLAPNLAPGNPYLGVMLPYTPLHHLLLQALGRPVVATSGNISDEPICIDEQDALHRLQGIAELFLVHNRPIRRHVDDSIVRLMAGRELLLRRARGYAPLPVMLPDALPPALAVGAHLKNTIAAAVGKQVFISQHIGDLETEAAEDAFREAIDSLTGLYEHPPVYLAADQHPDYLSTHYAREQGKPLLQVQHHYAHILSCMAENELSPPLLGISWDGTGYGPDHTIWGGEFLRIEEGGYHRAGCLRPFPLPGGDRAVREPRRSAAGLLFEMSGEILPESANDETFRPPEREIILQMLRRGVNAPYTSSMGRLFDAVASLIGLRQVNRFEGQAAMELEFLIADSPGDEFYPFQLQRHENTENPPDFYLDWAPLIRALLIDRAVGVARSLISAKFHNTLAEMALAAAREAGLPRVALSGGCFQNRYLTERIIRRLAEEGFHPYWHQRVPPNDGGIALGQIAALAGVLKHHLERLQQVVDGRMGG